MIVFWLQIILDIERPIIRLIESSRENLFKDLFQCTSLTRYPGSIGHYDWLRISTGKIIGVRFWFFDDAIHKDALDLLCRHSLELNYAIIDPLSKYISFIFIPNQEIDENLSNDQDLGENGIYQTDSGDLALCFEVDPTQLPFFEITEH